MLVCKPGDFDPSKIGPKKAKSKRRKATKPKKRTSSKCRKGPIIDSPDSAQSQETDEEPRSEGGVDIVGGVDPLHVGAYDTDGENGEAGEEGEGGDRVGEEGEGEEEEEPMEVRSSVPGEKIAAALVNTVSKDTLRLQAQVCHSETLFQHGCMVTLYQLCVSNCGNPLPISFCVLPL